MFARCASISATDSADAADLVGAPDRPKGSRAEVRQDGGRVVLERGPHPVRVLVRAVAEFAQGSIENLPTVSF